MLWGFIRAFQSDTSQNMSLLPTEETLKKDTFSSVAIIAPRRTTCGSFPSGRVEQWRQMESFSTKKNLVWMFLLSWITKVLIVRPHCRHKEADAIPRSHLQSAFFVAGIIATGINKCPVFAAQGSSFSLSLALSCFLSRSLILSLSVSLCLSFSLSLYFFLFLFLSLSLFRSLSPSLCLSLVLSLSLSLSPTLSLSLSLSLSLACSLSLSFSLSLALSISLSQLISLSVFHPITRKHAHIHTHHVCVCVCLFVRDTYIFTQKNVHTYYRRSKSYFSSAPKPVTSGTRLTCRSRVSYFVIFEWVSLRCHMSSFVHLYVVRDTHLLLLEHVWHAGVSSCHMSSFVTFICNSLWHLPPTRRFRTCQ